MPQLARAVVASFHNGRNDKAHMPSDAEKNSGDLFIDLTDANFKHAVIDSKKPFIIEIRADWCGECFIMEAILKQLAAEFSHQISFGYVNVDTNEEITKQFGVTELPLLMFFKEGELAHHCIGLRSRSSVRQQLVKIYMPVTP
ncbi:hypothetical protein JXA02_01050 [candidate division KSB1 bacterium]|nr:hypothetical protein [candidate division KSB1 bacterium]RQW11071.1 MAG: hypothetical protein EH222_01115 [candidate division KSB1 bacterium]